MQQKTRRAPFAHGLVAKVSDKTRQKTVRRGGRRLRRTGERGRRRAVAGGALVTLRSKLASSSALSNIRH